ncbi:MAG: hypothetical protein JO165_04720, partial [Candidatus Eremiobacteraeota bacterium]|nr:hypothetical protein [Candidatus Eremiobacteraeota bacterium]
MSTTAAEAAPTKIWVALVATTVFPVPTPAVEAVDSSTGTILKMIRLGVYGLIANSPDQHHVYVPVQDGSANYLYDINSSTYAMRKILIPGDTSTNAILSLNVSSDGRLIYLATNSHIDAISSLAWAITHSRPYSLGSNAETHPAALSHDGKTLYFVMASG